MNWRSLGLRLLGFLGHNNCVGGGTNWGKPRPKETADTAPIIQMIVQSSINLLIPVPASGSVTGGAYNLNMSQPGLLFPNAEEDTRILNAVIKATGKGVIVWQKSDTEFTADVQGTRLVLSGINLTIESEGRQIKFITGSPGSAGSGPKTPASVVTAMRQLFEAAIHQVTQADSRIIEILLSNLAE